MKQMKRTRLERLVNDGVVEIVETIESRNYDVVRICWIDRNTQENVQVTK